jgi:hypothetical protein
MDVQEMQVRLDELCSREGVRLDQPGIDTPGMMYVEFGYLEGPQIVDRYTSRAPNAESRYLVCLHEIGHFAHGHTQGRPINDYYMAEKNPDFDLEYFEDREFYFNNGVLKSEAQAWNWALDHCQIPSDDIAPETRRFMWDTCLGSYFRHAQSVGFETPGQFLYNGDRGYVSFAYGKPDSYFYQTKRRIVEGDNEEDMKRAETSRSLEERVSGIADEQLNRVIHWDSTQSVWSQASEWVTSATMTYNNSR